jgi:hypothetical protein
MQEQYHAGEGTDSGNGVFAKMKNNLLPFSLVLCLLTTGASVYFYRQTVSLRSGNPQAEAQQKVQELVREVSQHLVLPEGEIPTVAAISDLEPLKTQRFFANAQVGDMLLIYEQARKAVLYSPSKRKVVEVGPVTPTPAPTSAPVEKK